MCLASLTGRKFQSVSLLTRLIPGAMALVSAQSLWSAPVHWSVNDHHYERVDGSISWSSAKTAAESRTSFGVHGHLATITSAAENAFIVGNLGGGSVLNKHFLGGYQDLSDPGYFEPSGAWKWVTGEPWAYANWHSGEPNNAEGGIEHWLEFLYGDGTWNDMQNNYPGWTTGYVVEYPTVKIQVHGKISFDNATCAASQLSQGVVIRILNDQGATAESHTVVPDQNGNYSFDTFWQGTFTLTAKLGYWPLQEQTVTLAPSDVRADFAFSHGDPDACDGEDGKKPCRCCQAGTVYTYLDSLGVEISLGSSLDSKGPSLLYIHEETPGTALATPAKLHCQVGDNTTTVINDNATGWIQEVHAPRVQAVVTVDTTNIQYHVDLYHADSGGNRGAHFKTVTLANPDPQSGVNRLDVTETFEGGSSRTRHFTWNGTDTWELVRGSGADQRIESLQKVWTDNVTRQEIRLVLNAGRQVVDHTTKTYRVYPWGEELVQKVVDPSGANLVTTRSFYYTGIDNTSLRYGRLEQEMLPSGHSVHYDYSRDAQGREVDNVSEPDLGKETVTTIDRAFNPGGTDNATLTTIVETWSGQEVSRRYTIEYPPASNYRETWDIRCPAPGAAWDAAGNLVIKTRTRNNPGQLDDGQVLRVERPDGTVSLYTYSADHTTTDVFTGQADNTTPVNGTRTHLVVNGYGYVLTKSVYAVQGEPETLIGQETTGTGECDEFGRPMYVHYLDGTTTVSHYGCCAVDNVTDRQGIRTGYQFDELDRLVWADRAGVTMEYGHDAAGRLTSETRNDSLIRSYHYDTAGRLESCTDALNHVTHYSETYDNHNTIRTTTWPDNTTCIETLRPDGKLLSVTGTGVHGVRWEYGAGDDLAWTKAIRLTQDTGADTDEWTKAYRDLAGRTVKVEKSNSIWGMPQGNSIHRFFYNTLGQLWKWADPDNVTVLYGYDTQGRREYAAIDMDGDDNITFGGTDRITRTVRDVITDHGTTVHRTTTQVHTTNNTTDTRTASVLETSIDGTWAWLTVDNLTTCGHVVYDAGNQTATLTVTAPDATGTETRYVAGRLVWRIDRDAAGTQIRRTDYGYDALGRPDNATITEGTGGRSRTLRYDSYNANDQPLSVTVGAAGVPSQTTTYQYDAMGRPETVTRPDSGSVHRHYTDTGELAGIWGAGVYPAEYTYDYAGRCDSMTTWKDYDNATGQGTGTGAVTAWQYDSQGRVFWKEYANGYGLDYFYTPAGRLAYRDGARGTSAEYAYNAAGDPTDIHYYYYYGNETPDVHYGYDRQGRRVQITDGAGTRDLAYTDSGRLLSETTHAGGVFDNLAVSYGHDGWGRLMSVQARLDYDYIERGLDNVSLVTAAMDSDNATADLDGDGEVTSTDMAIAMNNIVTVTAQRRPLTTYGYDTAARLLEVSQRDPLDNATTRTVRYGYADHSALLDTVTFQEDNNTRLATTRLYDNLTRLTGIDNVPSGWDYTFTYGYGYNSVNQRWTMMDEDNFTWDFGYDLLGQLASARCTYNEQAALVYQYDHDGIGNRRQEKVGFEPESFETCDYASNSLNQYQSRTQDNATESFTYDADGNLEQDGQRVYRWDAENRLIRLESQEVRQGKPVQKLSFVYDSHGRRVSKTVQDLNSDNSTYTTSRFRRFVYDGWNLIAELDEQGHPVSTYAWGPDLSGSMQGAGGVGGLVLVKHWHVGDSAADFPAYDGTGNVRGLFRSDNGTIETYCSYDPFGQGFAYNRSPAAPNPFGWSTRYTDNETGLVYFCYRYYDPETGRWLSRDPIQEYGGPNVYGYVCNDPVNFVDPLGLMTGWEEFTGTMQNLPSALWDPFGQMGHQVQQTYLLNVMHGATDSEAMVNATEGLLGNLVGLQGIDEGIEGTPLLDPMTQLSWKQRALRTAMGTGQLTLTGIGVGAMVSKACAIGSAGVETAASEVNALRVGEYEYTQTVANHFNDIVGSGPFKGELARPYMNSPLTIDEIAGTGIGIPDPGGIPGALRYDVPGAFRGSEGTWELVVHPETNTIYHFNFVGGGK